MIIKDNNSVDFEDKRVFTPFHKDRGLSVVNTITGELYMWKGYDKGWEKIGHSLIEE